MFKSLLKRLRSLELLQGANTPPPAAEPWRLIAPVDKNKYYRMAACLIFKNEADYLSEWLEFHRIVGIEKFFLYNNNSTDQYQQVVAPYIKEGIVTLHDFPISPPEAQKSAYTACLQTYRNHARWIAFIDIDEFLYPRTNESLLDVLSDYEECPAVAVNWLMFSTSGHILKPDGLVTESYTRCQVGGNRHVRLIVNPQETESFCNAHEAIFRDGKCAVNELKHEVRGPKSPPSISKLCINHYWTRSVEEFVRKISRGDVAGLTEMRDMQGLIQAERGYSSGEDFLIRRFSNRLKTTQCRP